MNSDAPISIAHLTVYRELPAGIRKQIKHEHDASGRLHGATWMSLALHNGVRTEPFEEPIAWLFRPLLLRALYGWLVALRLSRRYDFVLLRHMTFDPFALLFAPWIRNRISVHHSKEVEELPLIRPGTAGRLAAAVERITGRVAVRCSAGVLGVTSEIARYECETRAPGKPSGCYPNGIDLQRTQPAQDCRSPGNVNVVFIAETFSAWHGLDRLIDEVAAAPEFPADLAIHLVGKVSEPLAERIAGLGPRKSSFRLHGFLETNAYREVLAVADVGIGSLAMDRQKMREGATLKVREMLAIGLPVYSGHRDTALPEAFPYYLEQASVDILEMRAFAMRMKHVPRQQVRDAAAPYIDKLRAMQHVADWLKATFPPIEVA